VAGVVVCPSFTVAFILILGPAFDRREGRLKAIGAARSPNNAPPIAEPQARNGHGAHPAPVAHSRTAPRRPIPIGGLACRTVSHGLTLSARLR